MTSGSNPFDDIGRMFNRMSRQLEIERMVDEVGHQIESFDPSTFTDDAAESDVEESESGTENDQPDYGFAAQQMPVDVVDEGDHFTVSADLPGFESDAIDLCLREQTTLYIGAESDVESVWSTETGTSIRRERQHKSIRRSVGLPEPVDDETTEATYDNGVLTVTLQKLHADDVDGTSIPVN